MERPEKLEHNPLQICWRCRYMCQVGEKCECRKKSPTMIRKGGVLIVSLFPAVNPDWWCCEGEFLQLETDPENPHYKEKTE